MSLPSRERGLKLHGHMRTLAHLWSLPSRERGLKLYTAFALQLAYEVAPFAGAWIEIRVCEIVKPCGMSLPSRERGLKLVVFVPLLMSSASRSLRGSVD